MTDPARLAALDVGGSHVSSALVDRAATRLASPVHRRDLSADVAPDQFTAALVAAMAAAAPDASRWGIAMPGPFDYRGGVAWFRGVGKFAQLYGFDVRAGLAGAVGVPPDRLVFVNDADAFVLGEWSGGSLAGTRRCAGITLGTGVGSGFVVDGHPVHSHPALPPYGEVHELTVDGRPLEDHVSRRAIRRAFGDRTGDPSGAVDVAEIAQRARAGDADARTVLEAAFTTLGRALGPVLNAFGAERLVVGGSIAGSWPLLAPWFATGADAAGAPAPPTVVAADPEAAALIGAARFALDATPG
jgi:glucokinase